jgi:hypothetical protein
MEAPSSVFAEGFLYFEIEIGVIEMKNRWMIELRRLVAKN